MSSEATRRKTLSSEKMSDDCKKEGAGTGEWVSHNYLLLTYVTYLTYSNPKNDFFQSLSPSLNKHHQMFIIATMMTRRPDYDTEWQPLFSLN